MKVHDLIKNYFSIKNNNEDYLETKLSTLSYIKIIMSNYIMIANI